MLDDQENKLPDATENQTNDKPESLKDEITKEPIKKVTPESDLTADSGEKVEMEAKESDKKEKLAEVKKTDEVEETAPVKEKKTEIVKNEIKKSEESAIEKLETTEEKTDEVKATDSSEEKKSEAVEKETPKSEEVSKESTEAKTKSLDTEKTDEVVEEEPKRLISHEAVEAVEKQVAKDSENLHRVSQVPMEDYDALDLEGVVTTITALIAEHPIQAIKKHVDALKRVFNKKFGKLLKEAKTKFLDEGGNTIDFHYENPVQEQYNKALFDYKKRLKSYYKELEKKYEINLLQKRAIIEELKELIDNGEATSMYKHFNEIQKKWRDIGPVAREHYSDLWRTYHFHVERFYDLLHLRNDLRDLDFKHNLEEKLKLVARVELLSESDNITKAFNELQEIHRIWKEDIGPVSRDKREEVWGRFSTATKKIHDKRHNFFDGLKEEFKDNLAKKKTVIEEIANFDVSNNKTHNDWQRSIKEIANLRQQFFDIGKVPRAKNNEIWEKFKEATKGFNKQKNNFYKEIKNEQNVNLDRKMKLVTQAESLRDSEDWDSVTEVMKKIQSEWKTIGHVPRKFSDKIWNRFKEACNHFFDRLHAKQDSANEEKYEVYAQKKKYLDDLKKSVEKDAIDPDVDKLKGYIKEWNEMGPVPLKQRYINGKFNKFLDDCFAKLSLDKRESTMIRYRNMIGNLVEQKDYSKLENETQFVRKKLDEVTKEKQQLENNMLFFSNADESNPMIKKILETISQHEKELSIWEAKLQYLRTITV